MGDTTIEWTATRLPDGTLLPGFTFNPWVGCTKVSPACDHCYAEGWAKRAGQAALWSGERRRTTPDNWKKPLKWNNEARQSGIRRKVFCASLADVFDNQVPDQWRRDLWALIAATPHLDWLLLTKRPQNVTKMCPTNNDVANDIRKTIGILNWPWPNVWLGTTVENQEEADRRIPHLLAVPAAVRFLSCEPLLGALDLDLTGIAWAICGGESGPNARPMHPAWARSLRDQCGAAGVPFFFKQWGGWAPSPDASDWLYDPNYDRTHWWDGRGCIRPVEPGWSDKYKDGGGAYSPFVELFKTPEYLDQISRCDQRSCREAGKCVGNAGRMASVRVGKKAADALLDGREWRQFPEPRA